MGKRKWRSGMVEKWNGGGVEEWKSGGVEEWRSGRVEEWKSGIHFAKAASTVAPSGPTFAVMTRVFAYFSEASTMSTYSV